MEISWEDGTKFAKGDSLIFPELLAEAIKESCGSEMEDVPVEIEYFFFRQEKEEKIFLHYLTQLRLKLVT